MRSQKWHFRLRFLSLLLAITFALLPANPSVFPKSSVMAAPLLQLPELLVEDDAFDIALGGGYLSWTTLLGEFCSPPGSVGAMNLTTQDISTLRSDCDISPANVAADDTHVYYVEWRSDTIERIPLGGGTSATVAEGAGLIFHRGLIVDDTHIYFIDDKGINRAPKAGGAVETLASDFDAEGFAAHDTYLYWTSEFFDMPRTILRVPKAGGPVETLLSESDSDPLGSITVDDTYVYYSQGGSIKRMPKAGGPVSILVPAEPPFDPYSLEVNDTHLYWLEGTGGVGDSRLRRVLKTGGTVENLALELSAPGAIALSSSHVYWNELNGIWRLAIVGGEATTEDDFFFASGEEIPVTIALDRIGEIANEGVGRDRIEAFAEELGLQVIAEFPGRFFVLGLREPLERLDLVQFARDVKQIGQERQLLTETGLVIATKVDPETPIFLTDQFIALFNSDVTQEQIDEFNASNQVEIVSPDPFVENQFLLTVTENSESDALTMANQYETSQLTEFSHANFWTLEEHFQTEFIPNDALFGNQWHHRNTGQGGGLVDADADTSWAWDFTLGDPNILIAVIDDGFDLTHEDLAPNVFTNPGEIPGNGIDDDANSYIDDVNGWDFVPCGAGAFVAGCGDNNPGPGAGDDHGTAVAGVAAARGDNTLGVIGSCPNCRILPIRRGYGMFSEQAKANTFAYAQAMGADIINNSWGHTSPSGTVTTVTANAINNAAAAGSVIFFAGGNANSAGFCGASYPSLANVIAVSSSSNQDRKVVRAATGNCIDILAPSHRGYFASDPYVGTLNVTTTDRSGTAGYNNTNLVANCSTVEDSPPPLNARNYTRCFGGTSSASPLAAGIAGLLLSADSTLTRVEVQRLLQDTTDKTEPGVAAYANNNGFSSPAGGVATHSRGRVNAFEAVRIAAPVEDGGKGGVDIFLRDNRLDWGNASGYLGEQPSNTLFESPRGFIGHWRSEDIKVDAPPYATPPTAATFDAFPDETPSAVLGEVNRVYVRVRNRGPETASSVTVKLHWTQFGTALPGLPPDFWTAFPADSTDTSQWHPLNCGGTSSTTCTITGLAYSGSSVAGTAADVAQIVQFEFPAPPIDPALSNHFCLLAIADSAQDPIDPESEAIFVVDTITPNDNNVTHRNYMNLESSSDTVFVEGFLVRNPTEELIQTVLRLDAPEAIRQGWTINLEPFGFNEPFTLEPNEEILIQIAITLPELNQVGDVTVIQDRVDIEVPKVMGGVTYQVISEEPVATRITLTPEEDKNLVDTEHTVTANVSDGLGNPVAAQTVEFRVSGANSASGSASTGAAGQATFSYTGINVGDDTITAWVDLNGDAVLDPNEPFDQARKIWQRPLAITLLSFTASGQANQVLLGWGTAAEIDNEGFNLWRAEAADGAYTQINPSLIPAQGDADTGASYEYIDGDVVKGVTYYYKLEDVDIHGASTFHGPVSATAGPYRSIYLPLILK